MPLAPEAPVGPLAQAPPDRPTVQLEDALNQVKAIIFADRRMDQNEMQVFRAFMEDVAAMAQNGGIGQGGTTPGAPGGTGGLPPSPMDMNQNTEDMGTAEGAVPEDSEGY